MVDSASATSPSRPALEQAAQRVKEISTLPHVTLRVLDIINDESAGAAELKTAMECDVSLCARVLRVVNSSAYGLRQPITNLQMAIAYLGFRQIRNLALTASIGDMFQKDEQIGSYRRSRLWRHMVAVGIASRMIAMRKGMEQFEDVFLAGLLHDIGIILEDQVDHLRFVGMLTDLSSDATLEEQEQGQLGYTHSELGAWVAEKWSFPELVADTIRLHHAPLSDGRDKGVHCVEVANMLCSFKGMTSVGVNLVRPSIAAVNELELSKADLETLLLDLDDELRQYDELFRL